MAVRYRYCVEPLPGAQPVQWRGRGLKPSWPSNRLAQPNYLWADLGPLARPKPQTVARIPMAQPSWLDAQTFSTQRWTATGRTTGPIVTVTGQLTGVG